MHKLFYAGVLTLAAAPSCLADVIMPQLSHTIEISRAVRMDKLVEKPGLQVNLLVEDVGGSTDMSPTLRLYLTLYAKGELCNYDASYDLGAAYSVAAANRIAPGIYEIAATIPQQEAPEMREAVYRLDARKATQDIQKIPCREFDDDSDENFKTPIDRTIK